jgi:hypothetical protein
LSKLSREDRFWSEGVVEVEKTDCLATSYNSLDDTEEKCSVAMGRGSHVSASMDEENYDIGIFRFVGRCVEPVPCEFQALDTFVESGEDVVVAQ